MEIRLLGPLEVFDDGGRRVAVVGAKLRRLLATLALRPGQVVAVERLVEDLWGYEAKPTAANSLQGLVSKLRRLLPADVVLTRPPGYVLDVPAEAVDIGRFERLAGDGRRAWGDGDPAAAAAAFTAALAMWRGEPLADFVYEEFARPEIARLGEARSAVFEDRVEADLACGRHAELVGEIEAAVAEEPLRERRRAQLMLALYRSGRQADALRQFQMARTVLADELGLDPGPELRRLEAAMLAQDHSLDPPVASAPTARVNEAPVADLPGSLTSFVGRDDALVAVGKLVDQFRLVTLTGPGGAGKTRLAVEFGARYQASGTNTVWFVEFARALDADSVIGVAAAAVGIRDRAAPVPTPAGSNEVLDTAARLHEYLQFKDALLIVDNCEHLLGPIAGLVASLLQSCRRLRVLATSREPLGLPGEMQWPVPPLSLPPPGVTSAAVLASFDGIRLFVERASAVDPSFQLDLESAAPVSDICRVLDGIPLAIELAAARVKSIPASEIAVRLYDQLLLLSSGSRTAVARHRTLRATVDWSYQLLDQGERALFDRLSVFAGGCSLGAAEAAAIDAGVGGGDAIDVLGRLVDKSLLSVDRASRSGPRYRMLETLRQYGLEQLKVRGELTEAQRSQARWCAALAAESALGLHGPNQRALLDRLDAEADNLRVALDWLVSQGDAGSALQMSVALAWYWWIRGHQREGRAWLEITKDLAGPGGTSAADYARALAWAAHLAADHDLPAALALGAAAVPASGDDSRTAAFTKLLLAGVQVRAGSHTEVAQLLAEARPVLEETGDGWGVAWAFNVACFDALGRGDLGAAEKSCRESLSGFRANGDGWGTGRMVHKLAVIAELRGEDQNACALYEESLSFARSLGLDEVVAVMLAQLARIVLRQGDVARAESLRSDAALLLRELASVEVSSGVAAAGRRIARRRSDLARAQGLFEESLTWYRQAGATDGVLFSLAALGELAQLRSDHAEAGRIYRDMLQASSAAARWSEAAVALEGLSMVASGHHQPGLAATLAGASTGILQRFGIQRPPSGLPGCSDPASGDADRREFSASFQRGRGLSEAEAVALGLTSTTW